MEQCKEILYPKDPKLKAAFQGLIKLVLTKKTVWFGPEETILAIMSHLDMMDDSNLHTLKASGPNFKKAKVMLHSLVGTFVMWEAFKTIEVFVFTTDRKRVQTFEELETICLADPEMSKVLVTTDHLDHSQRWLAPPKIIDTPQYPVSGELGMIDDEISRKKRVIAAAQPVRHQGAFRGRKDPKAARAAIRLKRQAEADAPPSKREEHQQPEPPEATEAET